MRRIAVVGLVVALLAATAGCSGTTSGSPAVGDASSAKSASQGIPPNAPNQLVAKLNSCGLLNGPQMTSIARRFTHIGATLQLAHVTSSPDGSDSTAQPTMHYCTYTDPSSNGLDILQIAYFANPGAYPSTNEPSSATSLAELPFGATDGWTDGMDFHYRFASPDIELYFGGSGDQTIDISPMKMNQLIRAIASAVLPQVTHCLEHGC